ncbi:MAG: DNA helicase RecQ [Deltaproteobacteria bacterium]|nr:DNA helicase RecQ [Deltaproteobacteria bacterium]
MTNEVLSILRQYWGHESFLDCQEEAVAAVLAGRDSVTVLPTGGGKSVCYQLPALMLEGLAIVVSPLIALMKDQVDALKLNGIRAAAINSTLTMAEKLEIFNALKAGELALLYVSPEKLVQERTLEFFRTLKISFIAIDEAHCISQWGHDFRPEYRRLSLLKKQFPGTAVHAYTATATASVRDDIATQLELEKPQFIIGSFDRPNLVYRVRRRHSRHADQVLEVLKRHAGNSVIIYCQSRREVDEMHALLTELGFDSHPYHAGMGDLERKASQEAFIRNEAAVMVATVAFGMGVDKSNVRLVLHSGMPKALENYQQESGRAGRDGLAAECILFYGSSDLQRWQRNLREGDYGPGRTGAEKSLAAMVDYIHSGRCRHRTLVGYFGQELNVENCGACDLCLGELEPVPESQELARKIISSILHQGENFGADYSAQILKGSRNRRILDNGHDRLATWGGLRRESLEVIKDWIEQLCCQGFLEREAEYNLLKVTLAGSRLLQGENRDVVLRRLKRDELWTSAVAARELNFEDAGLFEELRELRRQLAAEHGVPPYVIFSDASLSDMARTRPTTKESFAQIRGVGELKIERFAEIFTGRIKSYCEREGLQSDLKPETAGVTPARPRQVSVSARTAAEYFAAGETVAEVATRLERAESTVYGYLFDWLRREKITDPSPWIGEHERRQIEKAAAEVGSDFLKPIYLALGKKIPYNEIRIVVTCLRNQEIKTKSAKEDMP